MPSILIDTFLQKGILFFATTPARRIPTLSPPNSQTAVWSARGISHQSEENEAWSWRHAS